MELDLSLYPVGGYGLVVFDGFKNRNIASDLSKISNNITNIVCETIKGDKITCTYDDFLNIFLDSTVCLKIFHFDMKKNGLSPYEQEVSVIRTLSSKLSTDEILQYTPITTVKINSLDIAFIEINLVKPITIKLGAGEKSSVLPKLSCIINTKFEDKSIQPRHIEHMKNTLWLLNTKGIFHRDVKFENIMMLNDKPRLVDFGSIKIDNGQEDVFKFYNPTKFIHPYIHLYFTKMVSERGVSNTIGRDLKTKFGNELESFIKTHQNEKYFTQYMLHKKDCFDFAMWCMNDPSIREKVYNMNGGGLLTACFGAKCDVDNFVKVKSNYIDVRKKMDSLYSILAPLIYMDSVDFQEFKNVYQQQQGGRNKSKRSTVKEYILLRSNNKKYLVRTDDKTNKYILLNKNKVFLSTIRNKYRYNKLLASCMFFLKKK